MWTAAAAPARVPAGVALAAAFAAGAQQDAAHRRPTHSRMAGGELVEPQPPGRAGLSSQAGPLTCAEGPPRFALYIPLVSCEGLRELNTLSKNIKLKMPGRLSHGVCVCADFLLWRAQQETWEPRDM